MYSSPTCAQAGCCGRDQWVFTQIDVRLMVEDLIASLIEFAAWRVEQA